MDRNDSIALDSNTELLRQILAQLTEINAKLSESPPALSAADRKALSIIAPAIYASVNDQLFMCSQLLQFARDDDDLLAALDAALGQDGGTGRRLGQLLARCAGVALEGFRIERIAEERLGLLWRVVRC